jgi:glucose-6-phosphate 1-dehydrogenase
VATDSQTETYFKIKAHLDNDRWRGVPIYLEAGKKIEAVDKSMTITFRHQEPCLCQDEKHFKNQIIFRIEPEPAIILRFLIQQSGSDDVVVQESILWSPVREEKTRYTREYARLLSDAFRGDQRFFVSRTEALASWRFVDPILRAWRTGVPLLYIY